ncbi:MAG: sulfotransferase family 2 domain-containing protein [Psychroserpens sp.]|nr:sulfotransferase family 2 domain-containing protein [Psychroserpens sp.]
MLEINKKHVFIHYPKTGGTFVREILKRNARIKELKGSHFHHSPLHDTKKDYEIKFATVRNPIDFYVSVWKFFVDFYHNNKEIESSNPLYPYGSYWRSNLNQFIENILTHKQGYYSNSHKEFIGDCQVIKTETLNYDICPFLSAMDINYDPYEILATGKIGERVKKIDLDKQLKKELIKSEWDIISRYYIEY